MKSIPASQRPPMSWEDTFVYPDELISGSPAHAAAHHRLLELAEEKDTDFEPYGIRTREGEKWQDCSVGCRHFAVLAGPLGSDRGICMSPRSPRAGLLTFEHQGCPEFEAGLETEPAI